MFSTRRCRHGHSWGLQEHRGCGVSHRTCALTAHVGNRRGLAESQPTLTSQASLSQTERGPLSLRDSYLDFLHAAPPRRGNPPPPLAPSHPHSYVLPRAQGRWIPFSEPQERRTGDRRALGTPVDGPGPSPVTSGTPGRATYSCKGSVAPETSGSTVGVTTGPPLLRDSHSRVRTPPSDLIRT